MLGRRVLIAREPVMRDRAVVMLGRRLWIAREPVMRDRAVVMLGRRLWIAREPVMRDRAVEKLQQHLLEVLVWNRSPTWSKNLNRDNQPADVVYTGYK